MRIKRGYVLITSDIREQINAENERTGTGPQRALKGNKEARQIGLTSGIIYRLTGQNGKSITAKTEHVELALKLWNDLPDKDIEPSKPNPHNPGPIMIYKNPHYGYEPITPEFLEKLESEELRTGVKAEDLVKEAGIDVKPHVIRAWKSGKTKSGDPDVIDSVLQAFKGLFNMKISI